MPALNENLTPEEILAGTLRSMRDSVWAINDAIEKSASPDNAGDVSGVVSRNVSHLELMMANETISGSGEDLSDIQAAIDNGNAFLAGNPGE
jgi:hypothetical protein